MPAARWRSLAVFAIVPALLVALYFWSRGGQVTDLRLDADGNLFETAIDGRPGPNATFEAPSHGGIYVHLPPPREIPGLPGPRGISQITVTRRSDGKVLFRQRFSRDHDLSAWKVLSGKPQVKHGLLSGTSGETIVYLEEADWDDYALEVRSRNLPRLEVGARAMLSSEPVLFAVNVFRHDDAHLSFRGRDGQVKDFAAGRVDFNPEQVSRSIAAMFLGTLPLLALAGLVTLVVAALLSFIAFPSVVGPGSLDWLFGVAAAGLVLLSLVLSSWLMSSKGQKVPHVPDELAYIFEGRLIAAGHLAAPPPPAEAPFQWSNPQPIAVNHGKWATIYPIGHPLVLAIGLKLGAMWLVPPVLGAATVGLVYLLVARIYDRPTAVVAALLLTLSPFFLMTSSNFMSHTTAAFYLVAAFACLALGDRRPVLWPFLAGIFLGMVFNTRPLTGVAILPPFAGFWLSLYFRPAATTGHWRSVSPFAAGFIATMVLYFSYKYLTTGDPLSVEAGQGGRDALGFFGTHTLSVGLTNEQSQAAYLVGVLENWPRMLGIGAIFTPLILKPTERWTWFIFATAFAVMAVYVLYFFNGLMYGPRFWYEAAPLLLILTARGVTLLAGHLDAWARYVRRAVRGNPPAGYSLPALAVSVAVVVLTVVSSARWLRGPPAAWASDIAPGDAAQMRDFNGINTRLLDIVRSAHLDNALVLVKDCPNWQCFGNVYWLNSPFLDGRIVFARDTGNGKELAALFNRFPDRKVYLADYQAPTLTPILGARELIRSRSLAMAEANSNRSHPGAEAYGEQQRPSAATLDGAEEPDAPW